MKHEISLKDFNKVLDESNSAFLCGNGFSINFDWDFRNIFDRLYAAHKELLYNSFYNVKGSTLFNKKCKQNYQNLKQHLRYLSEADLYKVFEDALIFAKSIQNSPKLLEDFSEMKLVDELVFKLSQIDILHQICDTGSKNGIRSVNIEYWPILIHFYFAIKKINPSYYKFPERNSFIDCVKMGDISVIKFEGGNDLIEKVILNGFTIYYRLLFSIAIFSNGKAINFSLLENIENLNLSKINQFLEKFQALLTLNYDHILESVTNRKVIHIHGEYIKEEKEFVHNQSLGMNSKYGLISFSDILIGDFFTLKHKSNVVSYFASKNSPVNKPMELASNKIGKIICNKKINTFVIFGMSIANDQHILRDIMTSFYTEQVENPQIIYCYFTEEERETFSEQYQLCITFSEKLNKYVENIKVKYVKTEDIRNVYFLKRKTAEVGFE
ncbi:TPA: hypothetical protein QCX68_000846 [Bacillus wiedmannii]|nr:hypothetical protein [Bacillus wiedmannii]